MFLIKWKNLSFSWFYFWFFFLALYINPFNKGVFNNALIQRQTRLFLTQPLTIFYSPKDSKNLFFKKTLCFICNLFDPFRSTFFFFCIPRHLKFSVPGDCDFVILYKKMPCKLAVIIRFLGILSTSVGFLCFRNLINYYKGVCSTLFRSLVFCSEAPIALIWIRINRKCKSVMFVYKIR